MKHAIACILLLVLSCQMCHAQGSTQNPGSKQAQTIFYVEVLGNAGSYSLNFEQRLSKKIFGRTGVSYVAGDGGRLLSMPLGISTLFGKTRDFFELGLVVAPAYSEGDLFYDNQEEGQFGVIVSPTIGYRYQPGENDLFFKIAFTPLFTTFERTFMPSGGLSIGYSF